MFWWGIHRCRVRRVSAPWTFGRVLSGLLAAGGLVAIFVGIILSFISGDGDDFFWGRQPVEMDPRSWTCKVDATSGTQTCESNIGFGEITDKGSSFPIMIGLLGVGMIGVSIMLRLKPGAPQPAAAAPQQQPYSGGQSYSAQQQGYPGR